MDEELNLDNLNDNFDDMGLSGFDDNYFGGFEDGKTPMNKYSDLLKDLTNFDPAIQERIKNWLGLEWDSQIKDYKQTDSAIINEKGARWAIGILKTYMAKTNIITNISQSEFKNLQKDIIKIAWLIFPTRDDFGVKSNSDWYRLCTELDNSAFLVLAGAGDGKYTKFLGESVSRHETVNVGDAPDQRNTRTNRKPGFVEGARNLILGKK